MCVNTQIEQSPLRGWSWWSDLAVFLDEWKVLPETTVPFYIMVRRYGPMSELVYRSHLQHSTFPTGCHRPSAPPNAGNPWAPNGVFRFNIAGLRLSRSGFPERPSDGRCPRWAEAIRAGAWVAVLWIFVIFMVLVLHDKALFLWFSMILHMQHHTIIASMPADSSHLQFFCQGSL